MTTFCLFYDVRRCRVYFDVLPELLLSRCPTQTRVACIIYLCGCQMFCRVFHVGLFILRPMSVREADDPDMSNGDMSIPELTQAVRQLQAQQLAHEPWMQAMTNAVDDPASSLERAVKEMVAIHGAHTQLHIQLQQGLETAEKTRGAAMDKLGGIFDGMQATDAATAEGLRASRLCACKPPDRHPFLDRQVRLHKQPLVHLPQ